MQQREAGPDALGAEGEPAVVIFNRYRDLIGYGPGIDSGVHPVDGDGMRLLAVIDRPIGSVEAGITRQRARMEIEAADSWRGHPLSREHVQRLHVEEEVYLLPPDRIGKGLVSCLVCRPQPIAQSRR